MLFAQAPGRFCDGEIDQFGWSITTPFKKVASAAKAVGKGTVSATKVVVKPVARVTATGVKTAAKGTTAVVKTAGKGVTTAGKGVATGGKFVAKGAVKGVKAVGSGVKYALSKTVLRPVISKLNTLKDRRAKKLAWDRRKSKTPTAAERNEARAWAKSYLKGQKPPFGYMLSQLAGPIDDEPLMGSFGEPVSAATVIASVPVLLSLLAIILQNVNKSGAAPINPATGQPMTPAEQAQAANETAAAAQAAAQLPGAEAAAGMIPPGAEMPGMEGDDIDSGDIDSGGGAMVPSGGGGMLPPGVQKSHILLFGGVAVGLVVLAMMLKKPAK